MALLLKGAPVSAALNAKTAEMAESLLHRGVQPALAIVRVGERPDDLSYERMAVRRAQAAGVHAGASRSMRARIRKPCLP